MLSPRVTCRHEKFLSKPEKRSYLLERDRPSALRSRMTTDQFAFYGLIVGIVGGAAGIIGAIAAVFAAVYAKGSATQESLKAVERNTAQTAEQITGVKTHMAQVDEHLRIQNNREELDIAASAISIGVKGDGWNDEPQK